jgi:hypothetical protein
MSNAYTWQRRIALVTGASGGIGEELAKLLAQDHYDLVLVARSKEKLDHLAARLMEEHRIAVRVLAADLADPLAVKELTDILRKEALFIEVLVNNAGYGVYGPFLENTWEAERDMIQLNIMALTELTKRLLPDMKARGLGRILNVASTAAFQPGPLMAVYYATKAYVLSLSEALANELQGTGVTVTCLCPGPTQTGFQARAAMEGSKLVRDKKLMTAAAVARIGYDAMKKGKTLAIPGFLNKLMALSVRLTPRKMVTKIVRNLQERKP